jgi:hypothetical protein|tara:strand:+ start:386 stop:577 length:192 start_codon:yes stop_codon:yes gene_type:complete
MSDIKNLSKITTRYTNKEGIAHPTSQKHDFSKPTIVSMTRDEIQTLVNAGRIEVEGITIEYEK